MSNRGLNIDQNNRDDDFAIIEQPLHLGEVPKCL